MENFRESISNISICKHTPNCGPICIWDRTGPLVAGRFLLKRLLMRGSDNLLVVSPNRLLSKQSYVGDLRRLDVNVMTQFHWWRRWLLRALAVPEITTHCLTRVSTTLVAENPCFTSPEEPRSQCSITWHPTKLMVASLYGGSRVSIWVV